MPFVIKATMADFETSPFFTPTPSGNAAAAGTALAPTDPTVKAQTTTLAPTATATPTGPRPTPDVPTYTRLANAKADAIPAETPPVGKQVPKALKIYYRLKWKL